MADNPPNKTPEDIEKELSVGKFTLQQARTLGFQFGGIALGLLAGIGLARTGFKNTVAKWMAQLSSKHGAEIGAQELEHLTETSRKLVIPIASATIGSMVGGIASMYEHWVKVERERLSVEEINKDVAGIMEKRVQFEETIEKQHGIVKSLLEKHQASLGKSMGEKVRASQEAPIERSGP